MFGRCGIRCGIERVSTRDWPGRAAAGRLTTRDKCRGCAGGWVVSGMRTEEIVELALGRAKTGPREELCGRRVGLPGASLGPSRMGLRKRPFKGLRFGLRRGLRMGLPLEGLPYGTSFTGGGSGGNGWLNFLRLLTIGTTVPSNSLIERCLMAISAKACSRTDSNESSACCAAAVRVSKWSCMNVCVVAPMCCSNLCVICSALGSQALRTSVQLSSGIVMTRDILL